MLEHAPQGSWPRPMVAFALALLLSMEALAAPAAGRRGMVVTAARLASEAGAEVLRAGGNAADAAVASAFALAVCEPYSSGLGGGGFALVRFGTRLLFLDFREVAPARASAGMFLREGKADPVASRDGPLAVAVPGAVAGYLELHARFGKLSRAQVLAPAIAIAERGFTVDERYRDNARERLELLRGDADAARIFLAAGAPPEVPSVGALVVQRDLARTLEAIARRGADEVYRGRTAKRLAADMARRGGLVTAEDLASYRVRERAPLVGSFAGKVVVSAPPPSAGGQVVLTVLNALESLLPSTPWRDPAALHLYVEASKRAFADRHLLGDPSFAGDPTPELVDKGRTRRLLALIGTRATPALEVPAGQATARQARIAPPPRAAGDDTTHLSVLDAAGNAVALTSTINYRFGAGIVARGTGIVWNDEMDDFAVAPGVPNVYGIVGTDANTVAPGKVPLSTMSPTLVLDGAEGPVRMVLGAAGGPRIATSVVQIVVNHLLFGADIEKAVALGRVHHQHLPDVVSVEPFALDAATVRALEERGHVVRTERPASNASAIAVLPEAGLRTGSADPRGYGAAVAE